MTRILVLAALLAGLPAGATSARAADRAPECVPPSPTTVAVAAVTDERTLRLADGTEFRLAGLESLGQAGPPGLTDAAAARAKTELERLIGARPLAVGALGTDRYGRRTGLAAVAGDGGHRTLQEQLIAGGHGLVAARIGDAGCFARFLAAEKAARHAGLGLWGGRPHLIREADRPADFADARGRFVLLEGTVVSVNDRGAVVYVNFGQRWSEDVTVTIAKRNMRSFTAAGLDPRTLAGRRVRVRGWADERGGPWIEASEPGQIEFAN